MSVNLKDKKILVAAAAASIVVILILLVFLPSGKKEGEGEVISKRVKIDIQTMDTAPIDATTSPAASFETAAVAPLQDEPVQPVSPAPQPSAEPDMPAKAEPAAPKAAVKAPVKQAVEPVEKAIVKTQPKEAKKKAVIAPKAKTSEKSRKVADISEKVLSTNLWAINVASFPSLAEAQTLAGALRKEGFKSYITDFTKESVRWHRVRVGFFKTRESAEKAGRKIEGKFRVQSPWIVKPSKDEARSHY